MFWRVAEGFALHPAVSLAFRLHRVALLYLFYFIFLFLCMCVFLLFFFLLFKFSSFGVSRLV